MQYTYVSIEFITVHENFTFIVVYQVKLKQLVPRTCASMLKNIYFDLMPSLASYRVHLRQR